MEAHGKGSFEAKGLPPIEVDVEGKIYMVMDWQKYVKQGENPLDYWRTGIEAVRLIRARAPLVRAEVKLVSRLPVGMTYGSLADALDLKTYEPSSQN
jgi:hypothetical protein